MSNAKETKETPGTLASWQTPTIHRVGDVGEVFQMPGAGKISLAADDTGDPPKKPKGQE